MMKKRIRLSLVIVLLYGTVYLLNTLFFDIYKPYYLYTVSWTTRQVLPFVCLLTVAMTVWGKWRITAPVSFAGYLLGIVLGELLGGFQRDVPPQYKHYGWLVWGLVYAASIVAGLLIQRLRRRIPAPQNEE